jgi:acetyl esterase/lipase
VHQGEGSLGVNPYEISVRDAIVNVGWTALSAGWPDFAILDHDGGLHCVVELKAGGDPVRPAQLAIHDALRRAGVRVVVLRGEREIHAFLGELRGLRLSRDPVFRRHSEAVMRAFRPSWAEPVVNAS